MRVRRDDGGAIVEVSQRDAIPALVREIAAMPADLLAVAEEPPTLEEAYLRLMAARPAAPPRRSMPHEAQRDPGDRRQGPERERRVEPGARTVLIVPLVFVVLYPVGLLVGLRYMSPADVQLSSSRRSRPTFPAAAELTAQGKAAYIATAFLFSAFFLIIPTMMATILAANSFAGEKERHTLEGMLYTPATDTELVVGKILGAVVPAGSCSRGCASRLHGDRERARHADRRQAVLPDD